MEIQEKLRKWIQDTLNIDQQITLVHPSELNNGDYTFIVDAEVAEEYFQKLQASPIAEVERVEFAKPRFINFFLSQNFFSETIGEILDKKEEYGKSDLLEGQKFFVEHTQPNPFKEFHIGHLMNNAIGESIARILKANKAEVKTASYHGDVGLHVAKAVWAMKSGIEYDKAYAFGNKAYEEDENSKLEIITINKAIFEGNVAEIWKISADGLEKFKNDFKIICKRLGTDSFDYQFWEHISGELGKKIVLDNIGEIFELSEEAVVFRGENFEPKTHTRVFLTKEKLPTYEAKELGLAKIKKELYPYDRSITVTASEQDAFFDVVGVAIGEVFPELKGKLEHLSHGMLRLPSGKMSSRTGDVITAESLINETKNKILEKIKEREFTLEEKDQIAEMVAIGAIKFSILRQAIGGDIIFDFDKSISFEGDSGPYLQYTAVRANSVIQKISSDVPGTNKIPENWDATEVERYLYRFPEMVETAYKEFAPHKIVHYLLELASQFNSFYAMEKIIDDNDPSSRYKISLTAATAQVLKNGLHLLGIKVPTRM